MKVYMVEVGIELPKDNIEYDDFQVDLGGKSWQSLYNENLLAFDNEKESIDYIDNYVEKGVKGTYGFMWEIEHELQDDEREDFELKYIEGVFYNREPISYFKGGLTDDNNN